MAELAQERYLGDLSEQLQQVLRLVSLQGTCRPSGSFRRGASSPQIQMLSAWCGRGAVRFSALKFPGDVDLEEYLVAQDAEGDLVECRSCSLQSWLLCNIWTEVSV